MILPDIPWQTLKLLQTPFRHYVLMPERIPIRWSVSQVVQGRSDNKGLNAWAADLGARSYKEDGKLTTARKAPERYMNDAGHYGTFVHDAIEESLRSGTVKLPDREEVEKKLKRHPEAYAQIIQNIDEALRWFGYHELDFQVVAVEKKMAYTLARKGMPDIMCAGTMDLLAMDKHERLWVIDWKTSKRVKVNHFVQMGGYSEFLRALGVKVFGMIICRLPRDGGTQEVATNNVVSFRQIFLEELRLHQRYEDAKIHIDGAIKLSETQLEEMKGSETHG